MRACVALHFLRVLLLGETGTQMWVSPLKYKFTSMFLKVDEETDETTGEASIRVRRPFIIKNTISLFAEMHASCVSNDCQTRVTYKAIS